MFSIEVLRDDLGGGSTFFGISALVFIVHELDFFTDSGSSSESDSLAITVALLDGGGGRVLGGGCLLGMV